MATIECAFCEKSCPANIDIYQGDGIASSLWASGVISHYGSDFDGDVHIFEQPIKETDEKFFADKECSICDDCIQNLIDQRLLILVHSTFA